jgi:L-threonylcarbamoyladenylate synthase
MKEFLADVKEAVKVMKNKGIILYPTDTIWGIGCDATCSEAVRRVYDLKNRPSEKNFILLLNHESALMTYVKEIPSQAWELIEYSEKPLTIIYEGAKNLPADVISENGTVAIRVTRDEFCKYMIGALRKPVISSSANISGNPAPASFADIDEEIIRGVDYVVNWRQNEKIISKPSVIISLDTSGTIKFIRK